MLNCSSKFVKALSDDVERMLRTHDVRLMLNDKQLEENHRAVLIAEALAYTPLMATGGSSALVPSIGNNGGGSNGVIPTGEEGGPSCSLSGSLPDKSPAGLWSSLKKQVVLTICSWMQEWRLCFLALVKLHRSNP